MDIVSILCLLVLTKIFILGNKPSNTLSDLLRRLTEITALFGKRLELEPPYCLKYMVIILRIFRRDFNLSRPPYRKKNNPRVQCVKYSVKTRTIACLTSFLGISITVPPPPSALIFWHFHLSLEGKSWDKNQVLTIFYLVFAIR